MGNISDASDAAFRDYETAGVPASGLHEPVKSEIRDTFTAIDTAVTLLAAAGITSGAVVITALRSTLYGDLAHAAGSFGIVYADGANSGIYVKAGASGSGSWSATGLMLKGSAATYQTSSVADAFANTAIGQRAEVIQPGGLAQDTYVRSATGLARIGTAPFGDGVALTRLRDFEGASLAVTQPPLMPDFSVNPVDGKLLFGDGSLIPNAAAPLPTRDQLQYFTDFAATAGTLTYNAAADPFGTNKALRLTHTAATSLQIAYVNPAYNEQGDYRIRVQAKSVTGAGAQTISISDGTTTVGPITIGESGWTQIDATLPTVAAAAHIYLTTGGATDLYLSKPQFSFVKQEIPEQPSVPALGSLICDRRTHAGTVTYGPGDSFAMPINRPGRIRFFEMPTVVPGMTAIVVAKKTSDNAAPTAARSTVLFGVTYGTNLGFNIGLKAEQVVFNLPLSGVAPGYGSDSYYATGWNPTGDDFMIYALRVDGTRAAANIGAVQIGLGAGTGGVPLTITDAVVGGFDATDPFTGFGGVIEGYFRYLSDDQVKQAVRSVRDRMRLYGHSVGPRNVLVTIGDSITEGVAGPTGPSKSFANLITRSFSPQLMRVNEAVYGATLGTAADVGTSSNTSYARLAQTVARIREGVSDGVNVVASVMIGRNGVPDTASYYAYLDALKAAGAKVMVWTVTGNSDTALTAFQTVVRNAVTLGHADAVADVTTNAHLYGAGVGSDTTYFADGVHPTDVGHGLLRDIGAPPLATLVAA